MAEQRVQRIKDIKETAIAIDDWDDVFSDFDPRPLRERTLSEDFIQELKKRYRETRIGTFLISLYAPVTLRSDESEKIVTQRLRRHFKRLALQRQRELGRIRLRGCIFVVVGICLLSFLTLATYYSLFSAFMIDLLGIILMPLGWFGIWEGFSKIVDTSPMFRKEEVLFDRLSRARYRFVYISEDDEEHT